MFGYTMLAGGAPKEIDTGFVSFTVAADTGAGETGTNSAWISLGSLLAKDGASASILWPESALTSHTSSYVDLTAAGFTVPADAFDIAYEVEVTGSRSGTLPFHFLVTGLLTTGGPTGNFFTPLLPTALAAWTGVLVPGAPLTAADINAAGFGVRIQGQINDTIPSGGVTSNVDAVRLRLKYKTYT